MTPSSTPKATEVELLAGANQIIQLAQKELAQKLGLAPEAIQLVSVEAVEWSDTSLGCPQPGMMYPQVITPGFRVLLKAEEEMYEYHTDTDQFVVLCEGGTSGEAPSKEPDTAVQDGWPNETRDYDVTIVPPTERK